MLKTKYIPQWVCLDRRRTSLFSTALSASQGQSASRLNDRQYHPWNIHDRDIIYIVRSLFRSSNIWKIYTAYLFYYY